jgi:hypothetical protein
MTVPCELHLRVLHPSILPHGGSKLPPTRPFLSPITVFICPKFRLLSPSLTGRPLRRPHWLHYYSKDLQYSTARRISFFDKYCRPLCAQSRGAAVRLILKNSRVRVMLIDIDGVGESRGSPSHFNAIDHRCVRAWAYVMGGPARSLIYYDSAMGVMSR